METFTVGQLAQRAGVNVETVRFYEKRGLMPKPKRTKSGYRQYTVSDVSRILFIKRAKELGFTLKEIDELFSLKIDAETTCGDVKHLAQHKIEIVDQKIQDLRKIKKKLMELVLLCEKQNSSTGECPILEALDK
ncbi:MAG: MerR family transcriptional regulator [Calditrichaeota bacterium]|nr:MerR family transcriptional regulator [Calditrichota bacterium]